MSAAIPGALAGSYSQKKSNRPSTSRNVPGTVVLRDANGAFDGIASSVADNAITSAKIANDTIVDADIKSDAAIAGTKIAPNFGSQNVATTGSVSTGTASPSAQLQVTKAEATAYNGAATDGQVGAGATALIQQTSGTNNGLAQLVFQARGSQPFNRIVSSGGGAPFMAFATNNEERLRVTSSGQMLVNTDAALPIGSTGTGVQIAETGLQLSRWNSASAAAPAFIYAGRSKSATIGTNASVANNDELFRIGCYGADGTTFVEAARISALCDGTPGTNDMPGRLIFSTTADGASTPSERMRIDNGGNVVIGKQTAESRLNIAASSNATTNYPLRVDNSSNNYGAGYGAYGFSNRVNAGNLSVDYTVDVGGTFLLNTDGSEKLRLGTNGNLGLGSTSITNSRMRIGGQIAGSTSAHGVYLDPVVQPAVTSSVAAVRTFIATAANGGTAYTTSTLAHFWADQGTLHADSTVTNQYGFYVDSGLTGATNNFGVRSDIASGTGRWNFYANGTASNYFAGTVAVGTTSPNAAALLDVSSTTRGFLPPRMTTAQRDAITSPPAGLMIYNTTTNKLNVRTASSWEAVTSS